MTDHSNERKIMIIHVKDENAIPDLLDELRAVDDNEEPDEDIQEAVFTMRDLLWEQNVKVYFHGSFFIHTEHGLLLFEYQDLIKEADAINDLIKQKINLN